jgi:hypothetical protein
MPVILVRWPLELGDKVASPSMIVIMDHMRITELKSEYMLICKWSGLGCIVTQVKMNHLR